MTSTHTRRAVAVTALAVTAAGSGALAGAATSAYAAGRAHTSLSVRAVKTHVTAGAKDTITGDLLAGKGGSNAGKTVLLEAKAKGASAFSQAGSTTTGGHGAVSFGVTPASTTRYQLVFAGDTADAPSRSGVVSVNVGPAVHHRAHTSLSIRRAKGAINRGGKDIVAGTLRSNGHVARHQRVVLRREVAGVRHFTSVRAQRSGRHGRVAFVVSPGATSRYRLVFRGSRRLAPSHSGVVTVRVRRPSRLTISESARSIDPGQSDTISGVLTDKGTAVAGMTVDLRSRVANAKQGTKYAVVSSQQTATDGSVHFTVSPTASTDYVLTAAKSSTAPATRSKVELVTVRANSSLSIRAARSQVSPGESDVISGQLRGSGKGLAGRAVTLQERASGSSTWTTVSSATTNGSGSVAFSEVPPTASEDYQLVFAGGEFYDGCASAVATVTVS